MKVAKLLALVAILGMVGVAVAAEGDAPKKERTRGIYGKIVKVDGTNIVVATRTRDKEAKEVTVATDDKTVVTLDEKEAKLADLKADMFVRITPATGTAEKVIAFTKMPERKKKPTEKAPE